VCYVGEDSEHAQILQKSHRGFFTGILVLSGGFVAIIMFYFSTVESTKAIIYLVTIISLHSIMLLATGVAIVKINQVLCDQTCCINVYELIVRLQLKFL